MVIYYKYDKELIYMYINKYLCCSTIKILYKCFFVPRRLTERVNELLHTENVYVERLRHVVENFIPEMSRDDLPPSLWGKKSEIFSNIERVFRFHSEEFLPALRDCENDLRKLGRCFRRFVSIRVVCINICLPVGKNNAITRAIK